MSMLTHRTHPLHACHCYDCLWAIRGRDEWRRVMKILVEQIYRETAKAKD